MKENDCVANDLINALKKAAQEGQPVEEILNAVARGQEVDAWFEPQASGKYSLVIAVKDEEA